MSTVTRREWLKLAAAVPLAAGAAPEEIKSPLGFSLYGMKSLKLDDALKACAEIGYAGVEFALMPGYHTVARTMTRGELNSLGRTLADTKLDLHGAMENLPTTGDEAQHRSNLDCIKSAVAFADLVAPPGTSRVVETILGGKPAEWDAVKNKLVERLGAWCEVAKQGKTTIAVKPHVANALHTIDGALWLVKQVNSPWLKLAFDASHFTLRGVKVADAVAALGQHAAFVHVKDAKGTPEKFEFLLPGQGDTDYKAYSQSLQKAKYAGPVVVEVSGQISNKPGYDPVAAAKSCFAALAPAFPSEKR
jgi:inosose dehydratase